MPDPVFTCDWFSQNIAPLTEVLAKFKGKPDVHALEIGCFEGRGTLWMLDNILTGKGSWIHCIDTFEGGHEHEHFKVPFDHVFETFIANIANRKCTWDKGNSSDRLLDLTKDFDIIVVDGSHMAVDVLSDLVLSWPLLNPGGVMFMDDYLWPGTDENALHRPKLAIDAFLQIYAEQLKVVHKGYSVAVEKLDIAQH